MSYATIAKITQSLSLRERLVACAADEGAPTPEAWVSQNIWKIATAPGADDAWESAIAAGVTDPGAREDVITDGMILGVVQPLLVAQNVIPQP